MTPAPGLVYEESLLALQGPTFGYTPPVNLVAYGSKKKPRSIVLKKLEAGNRDILLDLLDCYHYKGKRHPYIQRCRWMEYLLLFEK